MQNAVDCYVPNAKPRFNRIPCPIHNGDAYNLHFSENVYHCFACGTGGNVISFTRHILNLDFFEAVERLNADFCCGLPIDRRPTLREQRDTERRYREITAEREKRDAEKQAYNALYGSLWGEYIRLDKQRMMYRPTSAEDELNPLYIEAVSNISNVCYRIDTLL